MSEEPTQVDNQTPIEKTGLLYRDGRFSKTAFFAVVGNFAVLINYMLQTWLAGSVINLGFCTITVQAFNSGDAMTLLTLLNGTYLASGLVTNQGKPKPVS